MDAMAHTRTGPRHLAAADAASDDTAEPRPEGADVTRRETARADTAAELRHRRVLRCPAGRLRVDVLDTWRALPVVSAAGAAAAAVPGLSLIAALASEWGTYRTPAGMAVYFTVDTLDRERRLSSSPDESDVTDE
jgi:hypothetical protein